MKIPPVEAELLHVDTHKNRQKNMTKLIIAFCIFARAPKHEGVNKI